MATPRLTLQALVDFVLTPGTINDAKLISEVRKHLQGIGDFKLPITPILDPKALKKSLGDKGLVGQIDKQIAGASKRLDNFQQKFVDLARTTATKGGGIFSEDAEANAKRAAKHAEAELASQRELLRLTRINEDALRRFAGTDVGSRLPETLKAMRDLQAGIVSKADLKRSGKLLDDVKQTAGFLTQHAARTGQIRAQAIKLEKKVAGPVLPDSGEATVVPGVPISIPGLTTTSKDLTKFAQDTAKALDDDRIAAATKKVNDHKAAVDALNERLKGTTKTSDALKKEMKKAGEVPFFKEFDDQVKGLKAGLKGTRTEFSRIGKAGDIDDQITERKRLEGVVKKGEGEIAKLRTGFETKIDKQRSESIGNTFKNVKALTETPTSQIQEEAGRRLLKGASTPAVAIQKAATVSDSRSIGTALRADAVKASAALDDYTKRVKTADAASDPVFKKLDDALVERRRLLDDNLAKTARLEKEASAVGQDDKTKRAAKLDLIPDDQSKKLSQARADLKAIDKTLTDSKLPARLKTDLERQATAFRDQINALQGSLDKGSAIGDLDQREEFLNNAKKGVTDLGQAVKKLGREAPKDLQRLGKELDERTRQRKIAAGQQVLGRVGGVDGLGAVQNVNDLTNALTALDDVRQKNTKALKDYQDRVTLDKTKENASDRGRLNQAIDRSAASYDRAATALKNLQDSTDPKVIKARDKALAAQGETLRKTLNAAAGASLALDNSLDKVAKNKGIPKLQSRVKALRVELDDLSKASSNALSGGAGDKGLVQGAQLSQAEGLLKEIQGIKRDLNLRQDLQRSAAERPLTEAQQADRGRRELAQQGADLEERARRDQGPRDGRAGLTPPLVLAATIATADEQRALLAHQDAEMSELLDREKERRKVSRERGLTDIENAQKASDIIRSANIAEAREVIRRRGQVEVPTTSAAPVFQQFSDRQVRAAQQAYGIPLEELETVRRGIQNRVEDTRKRMDGILNERAAMEARLTKSGAELDPKYRELGKEYDKVKAAHGRLVKGADHLARSSSALVDATSERALQNLASARYIEGTRIIEEAGGARSLSKSLRGIKGIDRTRLPLVRDTLQTDLGLANATRDKLASSGQRSSEEYKKSSVEAGHLAKAIKRVNGELQGYTKLTAQIGGLFRQFARYGLGYAALYQLLAGIRALVTGVTDLDSALVSIKAITQSTDAEMRTIEGSIKRVATQTKFTVREIANAGQVLSQAGVTPKEFPDTLAATSQFAAATESSIELSADLVSTMRNVFTELSDIDIANQLTRAVNISKLTAADLKTILSLSAQTAKGYNLTSAQYLSAATTLRNAGIKASTVATGLRQALIEIFAPDSKSLKVLSKRYAQLNEPRTDEEISQRFFKFQQTENPAIAVLRELKRLGFTGSGKGTFAGRTFDVRAENVIKALINNLDEVVASQAQIVFGNAAITASMEQMESLANSASNLGATLVAVSHDMSQDFLPSIEDFIDGITSVIAAIGEFDAKLRSTTGTGVADVATSGLIAGGLAAAFTPSGIGFARASVRNVGAFAAGAGVSGVVQNALSDSDLQSKTVKLFSDIAAVLATLILFMRPQLSKLSKLGAVAKGVVQKTAAGAVAISLTGKVMEKVAGALSPIKNSIVNKLASVGLKLPGLFKLLGLLALAGGLAYRYFSGSEGKDAEKQLRQAQKNFTDSAARSESLQGQLGNLRPSGDGFTADSNSISGTSEKLTADLKAVDEGIKNFFGVTGDKIAAVKETLRLLERVAADEAAPRRKDILAELAEDTSTDISTREGREEVTRLQSQLADADSTAKGLIQNARLEFKKFLEQRQKHAGTVKGETFEALLRAAEETYLTGELRDVLDATTEEVESLFRAWIRQFDDAKDNIAEVRSAAEQEQANFRLFSAKLFATALTAESPEKAAERTSAALLTPVNEKEQLRQTTLRKNALSQISVAEGVLGQAEARQAKILAGSGGAISEGAALQQLKVDKLQLGVDNLTAALIAIDEKLSSSVREATRGGGELRETTQARIDVFSAFKEVAESGEDPGATKALKALRDIEATRVPLEALEKIIAAGGGDSSLAAEKIALETTKPGQLRPTFGVAAPFESVLVAGEKAFQGIETRRRVEDEAPLTFASTPDARANRIALSGVDRSIRSLEKSKDFDKIQAKLVERKGLQLSLLNGEIAFEKKRQEEATGGKAKATIQTRIDNLREKVLTTEEKFANDKEAANLKELRLQEQRQLDSLRALKVRAEAELTNPFFSDYEGIRAIQEDYEAALKALVEAVRKRADAENLGEVKTQEQVDAIEKGAQSIREFVQLYQKIIAASEQYLDSVNKLLASDAVFADTDVALSVERRRRGIREPAEKRIGLLNERLVQSRGSLEVRQGNRAEILQKLNDFDPAQGEDARNQLLAQLAASSESLRTLRDEVAALELDVQAASLDMHGAMRDAFDLTGIMSDLRLNVEDSIRTLSTDIRAIFSDTFDGMASDFADALFAGGGERAQSFLKDITDRFETFFKNLGKRLAESLFKKAVFGLVDLVVPSLTKSDENGNSTIGNLLGFKGDKSSVKDTVTVNGKTVIVNGPTAGGTREKSAKEHNAEVLAGIEPSPLFSGAISKVSGKDEKEAFGGDIPLPEVEKEAFGGDIPLPVGKDAPADAKEYFDNLFGGDNEESLPNLPASGVAGNKELLSDLPPPPAPSALLAGLNRAAAAEEAEEEAAGFFNTITTGWGKATTAIADGLSVMGTSISGLLQGLFGDGKGGQLAQIGLSAAGLGTGAVLKSLKFGRGGFVSRTGEIVKAGAGQVFGASFSKVLPDALKAATGADSVSLGAAIRRTHGGIIKGPGTTTSDSIPGVIVDSAGQPQRGILVSNDESILNGEATAALGAPFVNWINKNADRFANGGMISKSHSMGAVASSVSSSTRTARPSSTPSPDFGDLADAITSSMEGTSPQTLSLEVDDGALNRTLGDYLEGYFADVIATR